jgi:hypothetical protein
MQPRATCLAAEVIVAVPVEAGHDGTAAQEDAADNVGGGVSAGERWPSFTYDRICKLARLAAVVRRLTI